MSGSKVLLITGATGQQGGAVISALLAENPSPNFTILGVTRDANSASAKKLAAKSPLIHLLQGNLDDAPALFRTASEITKQPIWGVFSIQSPAGKGQSPDTEERQGKALVDEAVKAGVEHFVYTSVDRGGDEKSWTDETYVPHFQSKHRIELYLREKAGEKMGWTVLRPVAFMDNIKPAFTTKVFFAGWQSALGEKPLQLVAVSDIGRAGAQAFINPAKYNKRAIGLAGDEVNLGQMSKVFEKVTGAPVPITYGFLGSAFLWGVKEMGLMMRWLKEYGYGADVEGCRKTYPGMIDFETYLRNQSGYPKKA